MGKLGPIQANFKQHTPIYHMVDAKRQMTFHTQIHKIY